MIKSFEYFQPYRKNRVNIRNQFLFEKFENHFDKFNSNINFPTMFK